MPCFGFAADKTLTIGFAQTGSENDWSVACSNSLKSEAQARGITLKFMDGIGLATNQIAALETFITDKVDAIILAPIQETGWEPVLTKAGDAGIPVILIDRNIRATDTSDELWVAFIGSDFLNEGRQAAELLPTRKY